MLGPSIPRVQLLRIVSDLPNPTRRSIFQFSDTEAAVTEACFPRLHNGDTSPVLYADYNFFSFGCCSDESRHSYSSSKHRYSHSPTTHRPPSSRCCTHDKPHGLWEAPPYKGKSTIFQNHNSIITKYVCKKNIFRRAYARKERHSPNRGIPDALSLRSRLSHFAYDYAISLNDLYAVTLDALTIRPRKARREPTFVLENEASELANANDTPPAEYA